MLVFLMIFLVILLLLFLVLLLVVVIVVVCLIKINNKKNEFHALPYYFVGSKPNYQIIYIAQQQLLIAKWY